MNTQIRLSAALAAAAASLLLASATLASPLDPADPWMPPGGQYPSLMQNWGAAPQFQNTESLGMWQARFANGQPAPAPTVPTGIIEVGPAAVVTLAAPDTSAEYYFPAALPVTPAVSAQVAANENPHSPVMRAIRSALIGIGSTRGATGIVAANQVVPSISDAPYGVHSDLLVYELRVQQGQTQIDAMQGQAAQFSGDTQAHFNQAVQDAQHLRGQLESDFAAAANSTPSTWPQTRAALANDYQAYSFAVARAQRLANGTGT